MSITDAYKATRFIEATENYALLHEKKPVDTFPANPANASFGVYDDEQFWYDLLRNPEQYWNKQLNFYEEPVLCDWVARVPGLYFHKGSDAIRQVSNSEIELQSERHVQYSPMGKSRKVMGGIGTFIVSPDDNQCQLMSLSLSNNASTGIPVLFTPEVITSHKLQQGQTLRIKKAVWRRMSQEWATRFPSVKGIPRGYLVIDNPEHIEVREKDIPVQFHPCTIMEYESGGSLLYDFAFCTADSAYENYRQELEDFFERYRKEKGRNGRYLLAADMNDPLFEAAYSSPGEIMKTEADGRSQLNLITERIRNSFLYRQQTLDSLLKVIPQQYPGSDEILSLAVKIELPVALLEKSSAAKMSAQLVDLCRERNKLEELTDQLLLDNPSLINH